MSVFVDISDISIHATRTVIQESYAQLGDILDNEQGVEGFFDYHDEWDNEEADDFQYEVEVAGVISASAHKRHHEEKQAVIDRQKKQIKELTEALAFLKKEVKDKVKAKGEEE
jgi:hypothetical protein|tara:strand:+ start:8474 stop:8812 length:339 start_codon:yes stop_codon:yes gene_type:complete